MRAERVAIVQSNYIPWKGYFDLIAGVDAFVLYDDVQYTRRDWRNRNKIKSATGLRWLTVPVEAKGRYHQRINETLVASPDWARSHISAIEQAYARAQHRTTMLEPLRAAYAAAGAHQRLSDINETLLTAVCEMLGIETPLLRSSDLAANLPADVEPRTGRLIGLCTALGAREYVSGPSARGYLDETAFARAGIAVTWADYSDYPEYAQPHPPFEHRVSIVDLLLCTGPDAPRYMRSRGEKPCATTYERA